VADVLFQGTSALALDAKGRLNVPTRHRDALMAACNGAITLTKHPAGCITVFPRPAWEAFRAKLMEMPMGADRWRRVFIGSAVDAEIDSAGRLNVSPELREAAKLDGKVRMLGMGGRLELWDPDRHDAHEAETMSGDVPDTIADFVL